MVFSSLHYFFFAPIVIALYFLLPDRYRRYWLLAASFYFYAVFGIPFLAVLLASILITFAAGIGVGTSTTKFGKQLFLWLAVLGNLSLLYFFKYIDFSFRAFNTMLGIDPDSSFFLSPTGVILPLGVSFFTLQAIAYAVDIYRGTIKPTRSLFQFSLFLSFFPQLVAGPIMRAQHLMHQFTLRHNFSYSNLEAGLVLIAFGFFKKTLVADPAGLVVDEIFATPQDFNAWTLMLAGMLHMIQIYGDFSGYSDMAIGTGKILGFNIPLNFRRPLLAENYTDVWRRWHISLSSWLRDYVYIPLGGNRVAVSRAYINLLITWLITGLWHGADWTFIAWGLLNAAFIVGEKWIFAVEPINRIFHALPRAIRSFYVIFLFGLTMLFFRAHPVEGFSEGIEVSLYIFRHIFTLGGGETLLPGVGVVMAIALLFAIEVVQEKELAIQRYFAQSPVIKWSFVVAVMTVCFVVYSVTTSPQFIYFQF